MLRTYYNTLDMPRTYLKGYCHLIYYFVILIKILYLYIMKNILYYFHHNIYQIHLINKLIYINSIKLCGLFASATLHIVDFNNLFIEKIIFFIDYFFAIFNCHTSIHFRCSPIIRKYLFKSAQILLSILTISFVILIEIDFYLFRNIYHIGFVLHLLYCFYGLYNYKKINKIDLICFNKILIPLMSILLIKILPFDFNNEYFDTHDLFQLLLVIYDIHINDRYLLDY